MRILNQIFKWLALLVACGGLYLYRERSDVGRYALTVADKDYTVTDTKTGNYWTVGVSEGKLGVVEMNPKTGRVVVRKLEVQRPPQ